MPTSHLRQLSFLLCLALYSTISAQGNKIDSLKVVVAAAPNDTNKIKNLNTLSWQLQSLGQYDLSLKYITEAKNLSEKLGSKKGLAFAYVTLGNIYNNTGKYPEGIKSLNSAIGIYQDLKNSRGLMSCYSALGITYNKLGNYPAALRSQLATLKLAEEARMPDGTIGNKEAMGYTNLIGTIYRMQQSYEEALKCYQTALAIKKELHDIQGIADSYGGIGNVNWKRKNYPVAVKNYQQALKLMEEIGDSASIASVLSNMGAILAAEGKNKEALEMHTRSLKIREKIGDQQGIAMSQMNIGQVYYHLKNYKEAEIFGTRSLNLARQIGDLSSVQEAAQILSDIFSAEGKFTEALSTYRASVTARDSLINEKNTKQTVQQQMQYEFEKKENENRAEQERRDVLALADQKRRNVILYAVATLGTLILLFALFAYRSFLQKKRANEAIIKQKEVIEEKQKEILDSIHYARRIQQTLMPRESFIHKQLTRK